MTDLTPLNHPPLEKGKYFEYVCSKCGKKASNTYSEPTRTEMLERRLCFTCNHWQDFAERCYEGRFKLTTIDGAIYTPGNRTTGDYRGMAGRRFDIEYVEPSVHAGKKITTFDLWYGDKIPQEYRDKFPDTARFLGGAERASVGEITCFNPTATRTEPYPLPGAAGIN